MYLSPNEYRRMPSWLASGWASPISILALCVVGLVIALVIWARFGRAGRHHSQEHRTNGHAA